MIQHAFKALTLNSVWKAVNEVGSVSRRYLVTQHLDEQQLLATDVDVDAGHDVYSDTVTRVFAIILDLSSSHPWSSGVLTASFTTLQEPDCFSDEDSLPEAR